MKELILSVIGFIVALFLISALPTRARAWDIELSTCDGTTVGCTITHVEHIYAGDGGELGYVHAACWNAAGDRYALVIISRGVGNDLAAHMVLNGRAGQNIIDGRIAWIDGTPYLIHY